MNKISAVIITKNEGRNIRRCLESLQGVADEILIYDSGSTDDTRTIASEYDVQVELVLWEGYAATKNKANAAARYDHILSIDADEALSDKLKENIIHAKANLSDAYSFNRLNNYCGKWIRHGGFYPDNKVRLFNRKNATWEGDSVHEVLRLRDPGSTGQVIQHIQHLEGDLFHYSYYTIEEHVARANKYSALAAERIAASGNASISKMLFNPWWRFVKTYLLKGGFRDGFYGFCFCAITSIEVFLKYAKALAIRKNG